MSLQLLWVWLRCKYYKDGDACQCALLWSDMQCVNRTYMNCNERTILMQFLLRYNYDDYPMARPNDLN